MGLTRRMTMLADFSALIGKKCHIKLPDGTERITDIVGGHLTPGIGSALVPTLWIQNPANGTVQFQPLQGAVIKAT